ncbi:SF1B family DNA helicase RecD2 [Liberiplasma polymorphum]|uniref:SF1B family DNA helicase RecD2 n=1 Tax=Liberiplasma polymorphum TaxID=3374570 RepID=UPI0037745F48
MDYLQGIVKHITFYNEENNYGIIKVTVTETSIKKSLFDDFSHELVTVTGYFPRFSKGDEIRFFGETSVHPTYGEQFNAKSYERSSETNIEGVIDYLSSDLFTGVGPKTAEKVVNTLGKNTIKIIIENKEALDQIPKLTDKVKDTLYEGLIKHKASEQTLIQLYGYGISSKMAMRIISVYKEKTLRILEENPYKMIDDIEGIGFDRADHIAKKLGFEDTNPLRIRAMIIYLFKFITYQQGHTFLPKDAFIETAANRLSKDDAFIDESAVLDHVNTLINEKKLMVEDDNIALRTVVLAEKEIVHKIKVLNESPQTIDEAKVHNLIKQFETKEAINYSSKQKLAIINALKHRMMILTGGPGTGKTTVIKGLIHVYYTYYNLKKPALSEQSSIHLIAPTGRAAKRMQESTNAYAQTIHRFLGYSFDGSFQHDKYHQVEGNLFIIDEASMIDLFLASQLLQSLPDYANIIFVGDDAQLPSVGPGQVFKDLIDSKIIPTITLDVIHRQASDSHIIDLAQKIRLGHLPSNLDEQFDDRYIFKETPQNFQPRLKKAIDYLIQLGYDLQDDIQVLIPMYKGTVGIDETNRFLQETYNHNNEEVLKYNNRLFKVGDKILQLTNQIEDGVMNGDQGKVIAIDNDTEELTVDFLDATVKYRMKDLVNITHAYAMSIHKAQGSEYKVVILPIFSSYSIMLKRKLIYTAITRAKERIMILGHIDKLSYAVKNLEESRLTKLKERLLNEIAYQTVDEDVIAPNHVINDSTIPFDYLGEEMQNLSPYDFLDDEQ